LKRIDFYNNFAYLVYKDSLIILNISNVNSLTLVNSIPLSPFYDIVISNNHLYVFDYYSFKFMIFQILHLYSPFLASYKQILLGGFIYLK